MNNKLQSIVENLEKANNLVLGNNKKFLNEIVLNQIIEVLAGLDIINKGKLLRRNQKTLKVLKH